MQMIWQQPEFALNPRLRVKEAIREGDQIEERILRELGIEEDWMNRFPAELSGGELQRFSIARTLGKRTRFLLADEITTMLDLITQSQIWHFLLKEAEKRKIGLIVVSHDSELLDRVCTRIIPLEEEKGEQSGQARRTFLIKIKKLLSLTILLQGQECSFNKNSCGATRLDADHCTLSCILTYAFFDNGVQSPACLLCNSARPQKPIHSSSVIPRFHHPRLSVKHY